MPETDVSIVLLNFFGEIVDNFSSHIKNTLRTRKIVSNKAPARHIHFVTVNLSCARKYRRDLYEKQYTENRKYIIRKRRSVSKIHA